MTACDTDVVIVGGGVAGLGLACALSRYGLRSVVLEKRAEPGGIHRGDSLLPKTVRILDQWGLLGAFHAAQAQPIANIEVHHARLGKLLEVPIRPPSEPYPYLVLPHAQIEQVLGDELAKRPGTALIRQASVLALLRDAAGQVCGVRYRGAGSGREELRARLVVGCDGFHSLVRSALGIAMPTHAYDHAYLGLEAERPASYRNALRVHLHEAGGVLLMPRPTRVGVGVLVDEGSARHWLRKPTAELTRELCARAPILEGMALHRDGAHVYALNRAHAARYQAHGAVLIGDAAHCTNPTAGQGMATALSDAARLADCVGPALADGARDLAPQLARYEALQWPVNQKLVAGAHRLAVLYALRGPGWNRAKSWAVGALGSALGSSVLDALFRLFLTSPAEPPTPLLQRAGEVL